MPDPDGSLLARLAQAVGGKMADGLLEPVPLRLIRAVFGEHQRLLDESVSRSRTGVCSPEPGTHLGDGMRVTRGNLEVAAGGSGALGEQAHRIELSDAFERRQPQRVRPVERRNAARVFAADLQRLATGSQDAEMRACAQEGGYEVGARIDQVLTVV